MVDSDTSCQTVTLKELMEILPYCIPSQWTSQMALLPRNMWSIPHKIEEVLLKIYETDFPWEEPPYKGARRIWIRGVSHTNVTEKEP